MIMVHTQSVGKGSLEVALRWPAVRKRTPKLYKSSTFWAAFDKSVRGHEFWIFLAETEGRGQKNPEFMSSDRFVKCSQKSATFIYSNK